jgi:molybdopterin synthase sulfur carrier subunit
MTIELRLPSMLASAAGGSTRIQVTGDTARQALDDAFARHPLLRTHLLDEEGRVREHVHLFLNEDDIRERLAAELREGDQLVVLQQMSGGRV